MAIKNCLNLTAVDIKNSLKDNSELILIKNILNIENMPESEEKSECEQLCKNSILEQFNIFNLFVLNREFNKVNDAERLSRHYDVNNRFNSIRNDFLNHVRDFDTLVTNGGGADLVALNNKYNNGNGLGNNSANNSLFNENSSNFNSNGNLNNSNTSSNFNSNGNLNNSNTSSNSLFDANSSNSNSYGGVNPNTLNNGQTQGGYLFPSGLSESEKDKILSMMNSSDYYSSNFTGSRLLDQFASNSMIVDSTSESDGFVIDNLFNDDGNSSYLKNVSLEEIDNLNPERNKVFKCFRKEFNVSNYIIENKRVKLPILTSSKINNLKRIHNEILMPIFNYYYGDISELACGIKIVNGLLSEEGVYSYASGTIVSKHMTGEAVDISLTGVEPEILIRDIKNKRINIVFGVLTQSNGVHLTLPYTFNGFEVTNMIIDSPKRSSDFIDIEFL